MNTLEKAIKLREHMTGKGEETFATASLKEKWLSLAAEIEFKEERETEYKGFTVLNVCKDPQCYEGAVIGSNYCLWHRMSFGS